MKRKYFFKAPKSARGFTLLSALFLFSGFSALIYQVAWQRILVLHTGVGTFSISVIVASFMLGLGLGSHLGGIISSRSDQRSCLLMFSAAEGLVGLFGLLSPWIFYDLLYLENSSWFRDPLAATSIHVFLIALPTTLMGFSLPVLVRACVNSASEAGGKISSLYALNTLGAALGAVVSAWIMIRFMGIRWTIYSAALINLWVAASALLLAPTKQSEPPSQPEAQEKYGIPFRTLVVIFGFSGFISLSMEVLWFRVLDVSVKSAAFTFGSLLGVYLLGLASGSWAGKKSNADPWAGLLQASLWSVATSTSFLAFLAYAPSGILLWYFRFWGRYEGFGNQVHLNPGALILLYVLFPLMLFGIPTFCMGMAFSWTQKVAQNDANQSGYRVGVLQASNILGCVLGSILTGIFGLKYFGTTGSFRLIMALSLLFAVLGFITTKKKRRFGLLAAYISLLIIGFPNQNQFWRRLHGQHAETSILVEEDNTGVTFFAREDVTNSRVSTNGLGISWLPFRGVHSRLGALPASVHPNPQKIAVVGLGSGDTAWAAAWRPETQSVRVFEIVHSQAEVLRNASRLPGMEKLESFLADSRVHLDFRDGRVALQQDPDRYDIIELDALRPSAAYSGNLYSKEFYSLLKARLSRGGIVCIWAPTARTRATFRSVFPHVLSFENETILLGSDQPFEGTQADWIKRIQLAQSGSYLGSNLQKEVAESLGSPAWLQPLPEMDDSRLNLDLDPRDEFASP